MCNQFRFHLGYHYPRSKKTIEQTLKGSSDFMKEFNKYVFFPKNNINGVFRRVAMILFFLWVTIISVLIVLILNQPKYGVIQSKNRD